MVGLPPKPLDERPRRCRLPDAVIQARAAASAEAERYDAVAQPHIDAALTSCKLVLRELEDLHRCYADGTDLELTGYSRAAALWALSGRALSLGCALIVQVEAGICDESIVTGRAIHEAARILFAFSVPGEDGLVRQWLDDQGQRGYVHQAAARTVEERYEAELAEAMRTAGLPSISNSRPVVEGLYDQMSRVAHSRRSSCVAAISPELRATVYGRHPSPFRRASCAAWAMSMTGDILNAVGDALRALFGEPQFFTLRIKPLIEALEAVRATARLDEVQIRRSVGES